MRWQEATSLFMAMIQFRGRNVVLERIWEAPAGGEDESAVYELRVDAEGWSGDELVALNELVAWQHAVYRIDGGDLVIRWPDDEQEQDEANESED